MIPKRLLLTHVSRNSLEPKLRYCLQRMKEMHPDWEFVFFSDGDCRDFVKQKAPEFAELYDWYPRAVMRADLFRLLAVYRLGGFYLDTDFLVESPMDPLVGNSAVFTIEERLEGSFLRSRFPPWMSRFVGKWSIANYAFAAEEGHPFLRAILDQVISRTADFHVEDVTNLDILHSTGPDALTVAYYQDHERWQDVTILNAEGCRFGEHGQHLVHSIWWDGV